MNLKETLAALGLTADEGEFRFQAIDISVPNPTNADQLVQQDQVLDKFFNRIVGVAFVEVADGGIPNNYNVGFSTNRREWIDDINVKMWQSDNVGPNEKFFRVNIPYGSGDSGYVRVTPNEATTDVMSGQMVLVLKKDLTELPRV